MGEVAVGGCSPAHRVQPYTSVEGVEQHTPHASISVDKRTFTYSHTLIHSVCTALQMQEHASAHTDVQGRDCALSHPGTCEVMNTVTHAHAAAQWLHTPLSSRPAGMCR